MSMCVCVFALYCICMNVQEKLRDIVHRSMSRTTMDLQQHFIAIRASSSSNFFVHSLYFAVVLLNQRSHLHICIHMYNMILLCGCNRLYLMAAQIHYGLLVFFSSLLSYKEIVNCRPISFSFFFLLFRSVFFFTTVKKIVQHYKICFAGKRWVCIIFRIFFILYIFLSNHAAKEHETWKKTDIQTNKQTERITASSKYCCNFRIAVSVSVSSHEFLS